MKTFFKVIGKLFVGLTQKEIPQIRQSVLLIDGSFISVNNFSLIARGVKGKFRNANLTVLTFQDKKEYLKDNFPDAEIIILDDKIVVKRHELSVQLLRLVFKRRFDFVVLSSLDILILTVSLFFSRCPVFLYNRWFEWYQVRFWTLRDILRGVKSADNNRRKINRSLKDIVKSMGRIFVILTEVSEKSVECPILIEDNGYTNIEHVLTAVKRAREIF